ncbi:MAG: sulfotransferase [Phycisphaeraceae bacterium]|nr:sulfotransferase [Phycisphaeraceae bacterium]
MPKQPTRTVDPARLADFPALSRARGLWQQGRLDDAIDAFESALAERPENVKAMIESARAFGARHLVSRAEVLLDRALADTADDARVAPLVAQSYGRVFRHHRAIELLSGMPDLPPPIRGELAVLYEQVGRYEDALGEIERVVAEAPGADEPALVRGRILRRLGRHEAALIALESLARRSGHPVAVAEAWTEVCYILDSIGQYARALEAIERAHAVVKSWPRTAGLLERARANNAALTRLSKEVDADVLSRWRACPQDGCTGPMAHLIGFPRSGTTLLEQALDAHNSIVASPERVVFSRDVFPAMCRAGGGPLTVRTIGAVPDGVLRRLRIEYRLAMEETLGEAIAERVHIDKNPNHTSLLPGLVRLLPGSRFIVALRDPRDVVASCVLRSFRLTEFSAMLLSWQTACELYAVEMGAWLRYREMLPDDAYIEVRYEDTVVDLQGQAHGVLGLLGLPWDDSVLAYREKTREKLVNSPTQAEVRRPIYRSSVGRWRHYAAQLEPNMHVLMPFVRAFGYDNK